MALVISRITERISVEDVKEENRLGTFGTIKPVNNEIADREMVLCHFRISKILHFIRRDG